MFFQSLCFVDVSNIDSLDSYNPTVQKCSAVCLRSSCFEFFSTSYSCNIFDGNAMEKNYWAGKSMYNYVIMRMFSTVWSQGFLYKVAPPELKISPIMYFVMYNSVVLSKILKIIVPLEQNFEKTDFYSIKLVILIIIDIGK